MGTEAEDKKLRPGHRERMRQRFWLHGIDGFQDYEARELLLLYVARQKDMKPVAKRLIERFGSFKNVLDAPASDLEEVDGVGSSAITLIHFVKQAASRYLQQTSRAGFSPESPETLIQYCIINIGAEPNERFRVICLDSSFAIVKPLPVGDAGLHVGSRNDANPPGRR